MIRILKFKFVKNEPQGFFETPYQLRRKYEGLLNELENQKKVEINLQKEKEKNIENFLRKEKKLQELIRFTLDMIRYDFLYILNQNYIYLYKLLNYFQINNLR